MLREYDLFEKFPDGSSLWRASVLGMEGARFYMRELALKSVNHFYAIDLATGKTLYSDTERVGLGILKDSKVGRRSKSAAA